MEGRGQRLWLGLRGKEIRGMDDYCEVHLVVGDGVGKVVLVIGCLLVCVCASYSMGVCCCGKRWRNSTGGGVVVHTTCITTTLTCALLLPIAACRNATLVMGGGSDDDIIDCGT